MHAAVPSPFDLRGVNFRASIPKLTEFLCQTMAATGADAERSLLEGDAAPGSYGATGAVGAPGGASGETPSGAPGAGSGAAADAPRPALTPDQILAEITRNADVYKKMFVNALMGGLAPLLAEAMGTFVLVFTVGCAVASPTPSPWAPVTIATATGRQVLTVMVYATYNVSGAQLNPAVTFALALLGKKCLGTKGRWATHGAVGGLGWWMQ
eukprot:Skav221246  [mRNA]  locus=scaffold1045:284060:298511:+ [translate_table: standard]